MNQYSVALSLTPSSVIPYQSAPVEDRPSRLAKHIKRHWKGEFELLESFWVNVVFISTLIYLLMTFLSATDTMVQFAENNTRIRNAQGHGVDGSNLVRCAKASTL